MTGLRAKQNKVLWLPVSINQDSLNTKSFGITETLCQSFQIDLFSTRATIHERQTRNRDSLNIPFSRINAGQRAFYYRGVKVWNNMSEDLREITNTKVFKRCLINELICNMN